MDAHAALRDVLLLLSDVTEGKTQLDKAVAEVARRCRAAAAGDDDAPRITEDYARGVADAVAFLRGHPGAAERVGELIRDLKSEGEDA